MTIQAASEFLTPGAREYYGTKLVTAWPQTGGSAQIGTIADGYAVRYADGYTSWSPKDVFEAAYQPLDALNFGHALEALKDGLCVTREGWNGKGMFIYLQDIKHQNIDDGVFPPGWREYEPCLCMYNAQGKHQAGWSATQFDMLANDWMVLPGNQTGGENDK